MTWHPTLANVTLYENVPYIGATLFLVMKWFSWGTGRCVTGWLWLPPCSLEPGRDNVSLSPLCPWGLQRPSIDITLLPFFVDPLLPQAVFLYLFPPSVGNKTISLYRQAHNFFRVLRTCGDKIPCHSAWLNPCTQSNSSMLLLLKPGSMWASSAVTYYDAPIILSQINVIFTGYVLLSISLFVGK